MKFATDPEPWEEPVNGGALLLDLKHRLERHISLPEGGAEAIAIWILFTHCHDAFSISPILAITSPQKGCGKTTLLTVLGATVRRPLIVSNISPAGVFRTTHKFRPTLLIDEADTFLHAGEGDLRGILNSGHQRRGAQTVRMTPRNGDYEPTVFSTWAPKAIAMIGNLPDTLADRSVQIRMRRAMRDEPLEHLRLDRLHELEPLRRRALRWAEDHIDELGGHDPELPRGLSNRAADNWRPLIRMADAAGGAWPDLARDTAITLTDGLAAEDLSDEVMLLSDIRELFQGTSRGQLTSQEIVRYLNDLEARPWGEWQNGRPLSKHRLASLLRPFEITPKMLSVGRRGYERDSFADAIQRYLPPLEVQGVQERPTSHAGDENEECNRNDPLAVVEAADKPREKGHLADLAPPGQGVSEGPADGPETDTEFPWDVR